MHYSYDSYYFTEGMTGWHKDSFEKIKKEFEIFAKNKSISKILDFGCGDGFYGNFLNHFATKVDGYDISAAMNNLPNKTFYDRLIIADLGMHFNEPKDQYDLIFSSEVIEHVLDYRIFIANIYSLLKADGYVFMTTTTYAGGIFVYIINNIKKIKLYVLRDYVYGMLGYEKYRTKFTKQNWEWTKGHFHGFSKRQLRKAFSELGFNKIKIKYLFITPLIQESFFKNPFKNVKNRELILLFLPILRVIVKFLNWFVKSLHIYGSNVLIIAKKPNE